MTRPRLSASLRRLAGFEVTIESGRGARRTVQLAGSATAQELLAGMPRRGRRLSNVSCKTSRPEKARELTT
jgi:hypothetical protein